MNREEEMAARLDEDEALARQAAQVAGPDWTFITEVPEGCGYPTDYITGTGGALLLDTMGGIEGDAPHVARHDPARVLRFVAAVREIIRESSGEDHPEFAYEPAYYAGLEFAVRVLAGIYEEG